MASKYSYWIRISSMMMYEYHKVLQNYVVMKNAFVDEFDDVMVIFNTWNTTISTNSKHSGILCQP